MIDFKCALVVLLVATAIIAQEDERKCVDGKSYSDGCNTCTCMGGNVACTLMLCHTYDNATGEFRPYVPQPPPGDFWEPLPTDNKI